MYKIAKENLSALFQSIAENQELYLPVEVSGQVTVSYTHLTLPTT